MCNHVYDLFNAIYLIHKVDDNQLPEMLRLF